MSIETLMNEYKKKLQIVQEEKNEMIEEINKLEKKLESIEQELCEYKDDANNPWKELRTELELDLCLDNTETLLTTLTGFIESCPDIQSSSSDDNSLLIVDEMNKVQNFYTNENIAKELEKIEAETQEFYAKQKELQKNSCQWSDDYKKEQLKLLQKQNDDFNKETKLIDDLEICQENDEKELKSLIDEFEQSEKEIEELGHQLE